MKDKLIGLWAEGAKVQSHCDQTKYAKNAKRLEAYKVLTISLLSV